MSFLFGEYCPGHAGMRGNERTNGLVDFNSTCNGNNHNDRKDIKKTQYIFLLVDNIRTNETA